MLQGFIVLLGFQLLGEAVRALTGTPVPGPVLGMLLLWGALHLKGGPSAALNDTCEGFVKHLSLLFLPAGVGLFFLPAHISQQWLAIAGAMVAGTFISLLFSTWLVKKLVRGS